MADFKKGDRVLVEATVDCTAYDGHLVFLDLPLDHPEPRHTRGTESVLKARQAVSAVHAHPGDWEIKHIPDLVRECELATRENEMLHAGNGTIEATPLRVELHALRNAREAAQSTSSLKVKRFGLQGALSVQPRRHQTCGGWVDDKSARETA